MITCPRCAQVLPNWLFRDRYINSICPQCQAVVDVYSFPALYRAVEKIDTAGAVMAESDACCYQHASRNAASLCSNCGRFLCTLCEVPLRGNVFCPDCVHAPQAASGDATVTHRTKYDSIALVLAVWPLLIFYFTVITAPLALGLAVYAWNRPTSLIRRNRWRLFAAGGIAALEIAGIAVVIFMLVNATRNHV